MRIRTTEDLFKYLATFKNEDWFYRNTQHFNVREKLFMVDTRLNVYGELVGTKPLGNLAKSCDVYINFSTNKLFYYSYFLGWCDKKTKIIKDYKNGKCNFFEDDVVCFTTEEEANEYIRTYNITHKDRCLEVLMKSKKDFEKEIRDCNKHLKKIEEKLKEINTKG